MVLVQWTGVVISFGLFSKIFLFVRCFYDSFVRYPAVYLCVPSFVSRNKIFCMNISLYRSSNKGLQRVNYYWRIARNRFSWMFETVFIELCRLYRNSPGGFSSSLLSPTESLLMTHEYPCTQKHSDFSFYATKI